MSTELDPREDAWNFTAPDIEPSEFPRSRPKPKKKKLRSRRRNRIRAMVPDTAHQCAYCGRTLWTDATLDHVQPISRGGTHHPSNLVFACERCNTIKGDRDLIEWAADILAASEKTVALIAPKG